MNSLIVTRHSFEKSGKFVMADKTKKNNINKKAATIFSILILAIPVVMLIYAFMSPKSPLSMMLTPNRYKTDKQDDKAIIYYESQQWDKAKPALEEIVKRKPEDHMVHFMLGITYARLGEPDKAEASFKETLNLNPDMYPAAASLASLYLRLGIDNVEKLDNPKAASYLHQAQTQIQHALKLVKDKKEKDLYEDINKQIMQELNKID